MLPSGVEELGRLQRLALSKVLLDKRLTDKGTCLDELHVGDAAVDRLTIFARSDQPAFLDDAQVLRDVVHRNADLDGEVAHTPLAVADGVQESLAMLVGQRFAQFGVHQEDRSELGGRRISIVRHLHTCLYTPIRIDGQAE